MPERSIVVKLKADISDLRAKLASAKTDIAGVAAASEKASKKSTAASVGAAEAEKLRAGVRKSALEQEIRGNEQAALSAAKYGKATAAITQHKDSLQTLGRGFTVLGLTAAAGVGVAVKSFADFDESISHVAATGKDAQANLGLLRQASLQAGADTKYSATEAADGVEALLKAGVSAQDVLNGGLTGALNLAASGNLDVADSAEVAASAMTQFGLKGAQVPHIADLLAAGAGKAQGEVSDMGQALNQAGLVASGFGLSIEETVGTLAAFASAGLTGSDAGTSFKTMIQRLQNPTDDASATMKQLGLNVYDAQGKFVGMAKFAEQLKTKLSGLTDEQRNAALATIFGADAIRGANVLYKDGGQGISDWISQVNEAGYAAETAGKRMDNLKGDFEQLKGSIDTGLIQAGSGANDFLRDLTQQATKAANAFGHLSPQAQHSTLAFATVAGGAALGIAGLIKLTTTAAAAKTALTDLNLLSGKSGAALGAVGKGAAVLATAFVVAEAAGAGFDAIFRKGDPTYTDAGTALVALGKSADLAGSGMDKFFSLTSGVTNDFGPVQAEINGVGEALTRVLDPTKAQKFNDVISGWLPGSDKLEILQKRFGDLDGQMVQMASTGHLDQVTAGFAQLTKAATDQGVPVDQLITLFPKYKATLQESANALGVTTLSAQDYADWMGGKVPAAISKAAAANPKVAASLGDIGSAADTSTQQLQSYADALLAVSAASGDVEDAIDAAGKLTSAKGFKATHDQGTAKGRANQSALDNVGSKSETALKDLATAGGSQQAIDSAAAHYKKKYREIAEDIGYSGKAAKAFADDIIKTPKAVSVRVVTPGAKVSADQAAVLNHELQDIPENKRAKIVTLAETKGAKAAYDAIQRVKDKQVIAKADGAPAGAKNVDKIMKSLKDRLVKATARGDTSGAKDVRDAIARLKGKNVDVKVDADTSGAVQARNAIATVHGKTVNVVINRVAKGDADGGYISGLLPGYDGGGKVQGRGGPREDNVAGVDRATGVQTSWVSVGEMVTNAKSTANNFDVLSTINANPDKQYGLVELADGGLPRYAKGSTNGDVANVVRLQQNVDNARDLAELAKALKAQEKATKSLTSAEQTSSEAVKSLSSSFREAYTSKTNDPQDLLEQMQQGAADLSTFAADLKQLGGLGLSKGVIDQITAKGAAGGGLDLAQAIIDGGKSLVDSLNKANSGLDKAAISVGMAANGIPVKKAYGGPIWGGSGARADDVHVAASGGEFMVQEPIARSNMGFLQQFNAGRQVLPSYAAARIPATSSSVDSSYHEGDSHFHGVGPDLERAGARDRRRKRDEFNLRGLSRARA